MNYNQEIVPVKLNVPKQKETGDKAKIAMRLKTADAELTIFNGADKYIFFGIIKEMLNHAD